MRVIIIVIFLIDFSNHNIDAHSNTAVPLIVVTHEEIDTTSTSLAHHPSRDDQPKKIPYLSITPIHMDNISLKEYFGSTSCPGSPTLPKKSSSAVSTPATLSPPGIPPTSTSTLSGSGKRRGIGHRASYKRARIGRLVCMDSFFNYSILLPLFSLLIIHQMNYLLNCKNYGWMKIMNIIGMNVQGRKTISNMFEFFFYVEIDGSVMKKISMLKWNVGKVCILLIIHVFSSLFLAPKVGCLNFHSLLELRRGLQYGSLISNKNFPQR